MVFDHLKDEFNATETAAGKIGVVLFHVLIWVSIIFSIVFLIIPGIMPDCVLAVFGSDEYLKIMFLGLLRTYILIFILLLLYVERFGAKNIYNVGAFALLCLLTYVLFYGVTKKQLDGLKEEEPRISSDCWKIMRAGDGVFFLWPVVVLLLLMVDRFQNRDVANQPERQPLTS